MNKLNLLLIGIGPHARRIYYPIIKEEQKKLNTQIVYGVDLLSQKKVIEEYLGIKKESLPIYYIDKPHKEKKLSKEIINKLDKIVASYNIQGVIISTEPLSHVVYAHWALSRRLSILMDKPISIIKNSSVSEKSAY